MIRLVVYREHTLGYVLPEQPRVVHVLKASVLKGATWELYPDDKYIDHVEDIRLASVADFNDFGVSAEGYLTDPEYLFAT